MAYQPIKNKPNPVVTWSELTTHFWEDSPGDHRFYKCVEVNNHVLFIGGLSDEFAGSRGYDIIPTLSVTRGSVWKKKWNFRKANGDIPRVRYGHTATRVDNKVFVFGGRDPVSDVALGDFYFLDLDIMRWRQIPVPDTDEGWTGRYSHTCTHLNKCLFIIGGIAQTRVPMHHLSDVWIFNLSQWTWEKRVNNLFIESTPPQSPPQDNGQSSRSSVGIAEHVAIPLPSNEILIIGGSSHVVNFSATEGASDLTRLWKFNVDTRVWQQITHVIPRHPHLLVRVPPNLDTMVHHAATWRKGKGGDGTLEIFIHGGYVDGGFNGDLRVIVVEADGTLKWVFPRNVYSFGFELSPELRHHNLIVVNDDLYILGGMKDMGAQNASFCCNPFSDPTNFTNIYTMRLPESF
jgi:outer membrane protein assembly factor BamB